jgi:hypothetical protein
MFRLFCKLEEQSTFGLAMVTSWIMDPHSVNNQGQHNSNSTNNGGKKLYISKVAVN